MLSRTPLIIRTGHCTYDHAYDSVPLLACGPCLERVMHGVCAVSSDKGPCARHASLALRRACGQGAVLSLCMVRPGSGRFGVGFWVGFWVGLRARDFPTERVLSRTPLIIRTVDHYTNYTQNLKSSLGTALPNFLLFLYFLLFPFWSFLGFQKS